MSFHEYGVTATVNGAGSHAAHPVPTERIMTGAHFILLGIVAALSWWGTASADPEPDASPEGEGAAGGASGMAGAGGDHLGPHVVDPAGLAADPSGHPPRVGVRSARNGHACPAPRGPYRV